RRGRASPGHPVVFAPPPYPLPHAGEGREGAPEGAGTSPRRRLRCVQNRPEIAVGRRSRALHEDSRGSELRRAPSPRPSSRERIDERGEGAPILHACAVPQRPPQRGAQPVQYIAKRLARLAYAPSQTPELPLRIPGSPGGNSMMEVRGGKQRLFRDRAN